MVGLMKIDNVARTYYEIVGFLTPPEDGDYTDDYRKPFRSEGDQHFEIAKTFYESIFAESDSSSVKQIVDRQRKGIKYLKENLTEALLSDEPYIRELASLIYKDKREIP